MKFRNPFVTAVLKATQRASRKATLSVTRKVIGKSGAMQRSAMKSAMAALQNTFKHTWPSDGPAGRPKQRSIGENERSAGGTATAADAPSSEAGQFLARSLTNAAGTRKYKLYIPETYTGQAMPLLVMLHGCTQDPDDFAAGTRMNRIAEQAGCFVVYPEQSKTANGHKCWNWFSAIDQQRDSGEASIIADITRSVIDAYGCDRRRVFVAGLSAGGAMAVIMGNRYPELYSAVGVHSGLPYAAARDLASAMAAMRRGAADIDIERSGGAGAHGKLLPVIVFHGDIDKTVHPRNGEQIIEQALAHIASIERKEQGAVVVDGVPQYTRAVYEDERQHPLAELWTVHGAAHAWSGGSSDGSYTRAGGPDASAEMMRFFTTAGAR